MAAAAAGGIFVGTTTPVARRMPESYHESTAPSATGAAIMAGATRTACARPREVDVSMDLMRYEGAAAARSCKFHELVSRRLRR